jgi:lipoprotein-anchoring transpeptidase ErfK/SrfK
MVDAKTRGRLATVTALLSVLTLAAACTSGASATWEGNGSPTTSAHGSTAATITAPANGATDVATGTEIAFTGDADAKVSLTSADGKAVDGGPGPDKSTWVPSQQLDYDTQYTATISSGGTPSSTVKFTTMAKPAKLTAVHSFMGDGQVFGVAVPIVITLDHDVTAAQRAAVQKRLAVTSTPAQGGAWNWFSGHEVHYRPKAYWEPGTKLAVDIKTGGVDMGDGYFGRNDLTVDASIATDSLQITVDDKIHEVTIEQGGKVVKTMPASLGKKSTPSSSGAMVIMTRKPQEIFDSSLGTGGTPVAAPGGYRELVYYTMRLTWDGQFIHAAPWSVKSQGHTDVSHGCTNVSTANAKWIYEHSHVGDPVTVKNTTRKLVWGDGWTDWDVSWDTYIKGSAIPVS